jgi:hypothetical protein
VLNAEDSDAASAALRERHGFDDMQADAVMDNQWRRATVSDRRQFQRRREELVHLLDDLEAEFRGQ